MLPLVSVNYSVTSQEQVTALVNNPVSTGDNSCEQPETRVSSLQHRTHPKQPAVVLNSRPSNSFFSSRVSFIFLFPIYPLFSFFHSHSLLLFFTTSNTTRNSTNTRPILNISRTCLNQDSQLDQPSVIRIQPSVVTASLCLPPLPSLAIVEHRLFISLCLLV